MPNYEFDCERCGPFVHHLPIQQRDSRVRCPSCEGEAERLLSTPSLGLLPGHVRDAHTRNERSRHEPGVQQRHRCGSGCGCGTAKVNLSGSGSTDGRSGKTAPATKPLSALKPRRQKRPWMLGH